MSDATTLQQMLTGSWMAQALCVAAELQIADLLREGPCSSDQLAAASGADAPALHRLLRALTTIDICRERADGCFEITPMGALLGTGVPGSLRAWTIWWGRYLWPVWGQLLYSVQTGKSARALLTGMKGFEHLSGDPQAAAIFNEALGELTRFAAENIARAYDFSGLERIVDVGGGYGELLACILRANPQATGVLFDLEHAIEEARRRFHEAGLAERCEFVPGDFFDAVPRGADAYLLKSVIHDWDDERSIQILARCCEAMAEGGRVLLVERIMPDRLEVSADHQALARTDLNMLIAHAAQERTAAAFHELLNAAGLGVARVIPVEATFCVIEAYRRESKGPC